MSDFDDLLSRMDTILSLNDENFPALPQPTRDETIDIVKRDKAAKTIQKHTRKRTLRRKQTKKPDLRQDENELLLKRLDCKSRSRWCSMNRKNREICNIPEVNEMYINVCKKTYDMIVELFQTHKAFDGSNTVLNVISHYDLPKDVKDVYIELLTNIYRELIYEEIEDFQLQRFDSDLSEVYFSDHEEYEDVEFEYAYHTFVQNVITTMTPRAFYNLLNKLNNFLPQYDINTMELFKQKIILYML